MAPNSKGYTLEATYKPFGKDHFLLGLWANVRLAVQYVAHTKFNGGNLNYDGFGRRATDNNTIFSYVWLAF